jgi:hypothetical protein
MEGIERPVQACTVGWERSEEAVEVKEGNQ